MAATRVTKKDLDTATTPGNANTYDFERLRLEAIQDKDRLAGAKVAKSKETDADKEFVKELDEANTSSKA